MVGGSEGLGAVCGRTEEWERLRCALCVVPEGQYGSGGLGGVPRGGESSGFVRQDPKGEAP